MDRPFSIERIAPLVLRERRQPRLVHLRLSASTINRTGAAA